MFTAIRGSDCDLIHVVFYVVLWCVFAYLRSLFVTTWIRYLEIVKLACCFVLDWFWLHCRFSITNTSLFSQTESMYTSLVADTAPDVNVIIISLTLVRCCRVFSARTTARMQRKSTVRMRRSLVSELKVNAVRFERLARKTERNEENELYLGIYLKLIHLPFTK